MGFCLTFKGVSLNISLEYESARPQNSVAEKGCENFKRATFDVRLVIFRLSVCHTAGATKDLVLFCIAVFDMGLLAKNRKS